MVHDPVVVDNFVFSPVPVPEPSGVVLLWLALPVWAGLAARGQVAGTKR
jgi:hypothetical protein